MKIAITGTTGHIAASLIPLLIDKGHSLRVLLYEQQPAFDLSAAEVVKGALAKISSLDELVKDCDVVIHAAAKISINSNQDTAVYETNVNGTKNIFNAAKKAAVKKFIYISSIHAYEQFPSNRTLNEKSNYCSNKASGYDRSKRDAEKFLLENAAVEMELVILNPTGIVGPPDHKPSLMGQAIIDIYNKKIPSLIKGGFDFCDVRDIANGIALAMEKGQNKNAYFLSGKWISLYELHKIIMEIKSDKQFLPVLPGWAAYAGLPFIKLLAGIKKQAPLYTKESLDALVYGNKKIDYSKAVNELGYTCRPIKETIIDSINWYKNAGMIV